MVPVNVIRSLAVGTVALVGLVGALFIAGERASAIRAAGRASC